MLFTTAASQLTGAEGRQVLICGNVVRSSQ